ncbi:MAG: chemotaxis protein CheV [Candidatus Zixiibacteriota bacterium]
MKRPDKLDAESYLKSGSNELRVLEYRASGMSFGINILKVNKIVSDLKDLTGFPNSHPAVSGVFRDMDRLIPVIDLAYYLALPASENIRRKVIVTEFFGILTGFWVDKIDWIHHFKWEDIIDGQQVFNGIGQKYVLGIVRPTEERMVQLLDYETILVDLCPHFSDTNMTSTRSDIDLGGKKVLIVEDSPAVRAMLTAEMTDAGCEVTEAGDGYHGWESFQQEPFDLVISDVEMPRMDGLALTLRIRQSERPDTPVIIYSSIGDMGMKARAQYLKADAHITKLDLDKLLDTADKLIRGEKVEGFNSEAPVPEAEPALA